MSEEYSIGFQEGYQSGWNSALEAAPPQRQPLTDEEPVGFMVMERQPLTHDQRLDLLTAFEEWKHDWNAESILIDMVEAAHNIKEIK
jgi:hypothetical protein